MTPEEIIEFAKAVGWTEVAQCPSCEDSLRGIAPNMKGRHHLPKFLTSKAAVIEGLEWFCEKQPSPEPNTNAWYWRIETVYGREAYFCEIREGRKKRGEAEGETLNIAIMNAVLAASNQEEKS